MIINNDPTSEAFMRSLSKGTVTMLRAGMGRHTSEFGKEKIRGNRESVRTGFIRHATGLVM